MTKISSKVLFLFHSHVVIKTFLRKLFLRKRKNATIHDVNKEGRLFFDYKFDCSSPKTFNEYLCWLKINYKNELWEKCADKLGSKAFLNEINLSEYTIKTYKKYKNSSQINLDELPEEFVLKTNNDSGSVFVCNKKTTDFNDVFKKLDAALQNQFGKIGGEWVYDNIEPYIFAEEVIKPRVGKDLIDYKLFAFNGFFGWGFAAQNRFKDVRFTVFEDNFEIQNVEYCHLRPKKTEFPPKPESFDKMVEIAKTISKILDFVRVDFYDTSDGIKIGELTFFSQNGHGQFSNNSFDYKYGNFFSYTRLSKNVNKGTK